MKPLRILIAEDEVLNQKLAFRMLQKLGHLVDIVDDGKKALEASTANFYDVILMDLQMPEMDGFEAAREIRKIHPRTDSPAIIAVTSLMKDGVREECLAAGMNDYMPKPITLEGVDRMLKKWALMENAVDGSQRNKNERDKELDDRLDLLRRETDASFLKEMIDLYLQAAQKAETEIADASSRGDLRKLHLAAHTLKGSSANIGARKVAAICQTLEDFTDAGQKDESGDMLAELHRELEAVRAGLRQYQQQLG